VPTVTPTYLAQGDFTSGIIRPDLEFDVIYITILNIYVLSEQRKPFVWQCYFLLEIVTFIGNACNDFEVR
jgi:hypothetical protein